MALENGASPEVGRLMVVLFLFQIILVSMCNSPNTPNGSAKENSMTEPGRFMRQKEVVSEAGLPAPTLYDLMKADLFPKPVRIGPRGVAWLESEVKAWKAARVAERDGPLVVV